MPQYDVLLQNAKHHRQSLIEILSQLPTDIQDDLRPRSDTLYNSLERAILDIAAERFQAARIRINQRDQHYSFQQAIDGDTIKVLPPVDLRTFTNEIRVRLYGFDAPEKREDNSLFCGAYTRLLERLCSLDTDRRVYLIWERETENSQHACYPRATFDRGVANVFIPMDGQLLYVNSLFAMIPHVCPLKIRGHASIDTRNPRHAYSDQCECHTLHPVIAILGDFATTVQLASTAFPRCLYMLPQGIISKSAADDPADVFSEVIDHLKSGLCPYGDVGQVLDFVAQLENKPWSVSPFDLVLLLAFSWSERVGHDNTQPAPIAAARNRTPAKARKPKKAEGE